MCLAADFQVHQRFFTKTMNISIDETALECGFNNVKYFSKVFCEIMGTTQGKYKKSGN